MCAFLDSIEAKGFRKGFKKAYEESKRKQREEVKLVANYLKKLGKSDKLLDVLDNSRSFARYLKLARDND